MLGVTGITCFSQGEIPVNMYTGSPGIFINLATVSDHDLSETLTLSYNVNGINMSSPTNYGVGWSLIAGGQVSREVRGLPDDLYNYGVRNGWLYNSNYSNVLSFPNSSDSDTSTHTDEQSDQAFLANTTYNNDTEPDIFSFSAGGYSGKFVFDNSGAIKLIPYQDISIVPSYDNTTHAITGWTITTTSGVVYTFNETCATQRTLNKVGDQTSLTLFDREYNQYQTQINYTSAWMLTKVQSPTGAYLNYEYTIPPDGTTTANQSRFIQIFDSGITSSAYIYNTMNETLTSTRKLVSKVTASSGMYATCDPLLGVQVFDPARSASSFKKFTFGYSNGMLTSVTEQDGNSCIQLPSYKFYYNDWVGTGASSASQDAWGFYNAASNLNANYQRTYFPTIYVYPSESASERYRLYRIPNYTAGPEIILQGDANLLPNPQAITSGTLSTIVYPTGGSAVFAFEINQYYDAKALQNQNGGGLRIKSITYFDGLNKTSNIVKNFSYLDANGHSSGRLINRPSYVIPLWQQKCPPSSLVKQYRLFSGNAIWRDLTAVTSFDLGNNGDTKGSSVGYTHVTVTSPGRGRAEFDYALPAAWGNGSTGGASTDWSPTLMKFARPSSSRTMGIIAGAENYGYAPFPAVEYDYERGLITAKTEYNEANVKVRFTQTTYQYIYNLFGSAPTSVVGVAYDRFANADNPIFLYGRYSLLTNAAKLVSTETVTTYDEKDISRSSTTSTKYYYSSANHRFVSRVEQTAPDQTIYATNFKYVQDYATNSSSDTTVQMIASLKVSKRTNTVIEQWSTVKPLIGTEKTSGASLVIFRPFTMNKPLLRYQKVFRPNTLSDFNESYIDGSMNFVADTRYEIINTINEYDAFEMPISSVGPSRISSGSILGFTQRLPVAQFSNARSTNIAFSDFETTTIASFSEVNNYYGAGRTGVRGVHPYCTLTRSVVRPSSFATNYILSFWAKPLTIGSTLTLTVALTYTGGSSSNNYSFAFDASNTDYQYFTKVIPVSAVPVGGTFTLQILGQGFTNPGGTVGSLNTSLLPLLDDVSFYPDYANISSTTYDIPFGPNSVTGSSGTTVYTTYDALGRTKWVADQDHNVRQRSTYSALAQGTAQLVASLASPATSYPAGVTINFAATQNPCFPNATYQWDFGNGYSSSSVYTYSTVGSYTVNLKVTDPVAGTVTTSIPISVISSSGPLNVNIISTGVDGSGWVTLNAIAGDDPSIISQRQWYQRATGTSTWNIIGGATGNSITRKILPSTSVDFMCTATTTYGTTASGTITVSN